MLISVIISTYNSPKVLGLTLTSYCKQVDSNFEVIIADDGSDSSTLETINTFKDRLRIKHVWHEDRGFRKCSILNKAADAANGEYLIFTDGDCLAPIDFVAVHRSASQVGRYLSGAYYTLNNQSTAQITSTTVETGQVFDLKFLRANGQERSHKDTLLWARRFGMGQTFNVLIPTKPTFNGNNSSVFREDLLAVNGFDERMGYGGEDREFGYRLAYSGIAPKRIRYSNAVVHLDHPRGYVDERVKQANARIIEETHTSRSFWTKHGLDEVDIAAFNC